MSTRGNLAIGGFLSIASKNSTAYPREPLSRANVLPPVAAPEKLPFWYSRAGSVVTSSLRRDGVDFLSLRQALARLGLHPSLQPGEVEINHRGRIQRQDLAESQSAHHGIAQRLA